MAGAQTRHQKTMEIANQLVDTQHKLGLELGKKEGHESGLQEGKSKNLWAGYRLGKDHWNSIAMSERRDQRDFHRGYALGEGHVHERQDQGAPQGHRDYGLGLQHGLQLAGDGLDTARPRKESYDMGMRHAAERLRQFGSMEGAANPQYAVGYGHGKAVSTHPKEDPQTFGTGYFLGAEHAWQRHARGFPRLPPPEETHPPPAPTGNVPETQSPRDQWSGPVQQGTNPLKEGRSNPPGAQ